MLKGITIRCAMIALLAATALGQRFDTPDPQQPESKNVRPRVLEKVGIDQNIGTQLPLDAEFKEEYGRTVKLGDYFQHNRPVVLALVYYDCTMLCDQVLASMTSALRAISFDAGKEYEVVAISFDPREGPALAADKKKMYVSRYSRPGGEQGMHFLTGTQKSIDAVTKAAGFRYTWDEQTKQYAHASALILVTPDGTIAKYYYGLEFPPKDMKLDMVEASAGRVGSIVDQVTLFCYHFDPSSGRYGALIMGALRTGAALTVLVLGGFVFVAFRKDARAGKQHKEMERALKG